MYWQDPISYVETQVCLFREISLVASAWGPFSSMFYMVIWSWASIKFNSKQAITLKTMYDWYSCVIVYACIGCNTLAPSPVTPVSTGTSAVAGDLVSKFKSNVFGTLWTFTYSFLMIEINNFHSNQSGTSNNMEKVCSMLLRTPRTYAIQWFYMGKLIIMSCKASNESP